MSKQINNEQDTMIGEDDIDEEVYDIKHTVYCARIAISAVIFTFVAIIFL